jgi:hypothetical protein
LSETITYFRAAPAAEQTISGFYAFSTFAGPERMPAFFTQASRSVGFPQDRGKEIAFGGMISAAGVGREWKW